MTARWHRTLLVFVLFIGCDLLTNKPKETVVRCEQVVSPAPPIPEERQRRLDELADLNSQIDLAIAQSDWDTITSDQKMLESLRDAYHKAVAAKSPTVGRDLKAALEVDNELTKALDSAARHRHH